MGPEDETLVVAEGAANNASLYMNEQEDPRFIYWVEKKTGKPKGNGIRDKIIRRARGDFLVFVDDDDYVPEGSFNIIRRAIEAQPHRPHLFSMISHDRRILRNELGMCSVGGPQFVPPNDPSKLGCWDNMNETAADWIFIDDTLRHYPGGPVFHSEVIYIAGRENG